MSSAGIRELCGLPASGGIVAGKCFRPANAALSRKQGTVDEESKAFEQAVAESIRQIVELAGNSDELGAEILEFQELLLGDDEILGPVRKRISEGMSADSAWSEVLKTEIDDYASSDGEYMAARASDLADLRDRVLNAMMANGSGQTPEPTLGDVIVADDIGPSVLIDWADRNLAAGVALGAGSATAHSAIVARSKGLPMAVGISGLEDIRSGAALLLDGDAGTVTVGAQARLAKIRDTRMAKVKEARRIEAEFAAKPALTASGKPIKVLLNVEDPDDLEKLNPKICDGIGLFRTEFLFMGECLPSEEVQYNAYRRVVEWADGRPVTIRTLDAGGDKPVAGLTMVSETNPFLGVRGLRLSLANLAQFRMQLRAISRAAALGPVKAMLPMVTVPSEFAEAEKHLDEALRALEAEGTACAKPALGIMVETPAAALTAADWPAEFYSIGSNDLVQYVTACARDNPRVAGLADPANPAVLELMRRTVEAGRARDAEVSICGEMASDPEHVHSLLEVGLDTLSVTAAYAGRVKHAISKFGGGP